MVDIKGAVKRPGPYSFRLGDRVQDAIKRAAVTAEADIKQLNLAARLIDGQEVIVPTKKKTKALKKAATEKSEQAEVPKGLLDLNAATEDQLLEVPGIGPAMAQRIVDYRAANGGFQSLDDLKKGKGIGAAKFERIKDKISL